MKRQKNDATDAEAICEAVTRPTMRFVPVKSEEQQGVLMLHRVRELLIRQRTMLVNALRGHLAEFVNCPPFRPDSRHKQKGSSTGLRTGLCLTSIDTLNC